MLNIHPVVAILYVVGLLFVAISIAIINSIAFGLLALGCGCIIGAVVKLMED